MYGGLCGVDTNNYFFANGKTYFCGNCIDLPPVGDSGMPFEELERIPFLRTMAGSRMLRECDPKFDSRDEAGKEKARREMAWMS